MDGCCYAENGFRFYSMTGAYGMLSRGGLQKRLKKFDLKWTKM